MIAMRVILSMVMGMAFMSVVRVIVVMSVWMRMAIMRVMGMMVVIVCVTA